MPPTQPQQFAPFHPQLARSCSPRQDLPRLRDELARGGVPRRGVDDGQDASGAFFGRDARPYAGDRPVGGGGGAHGRLDEARVHRQADESVGGVLRVQRHAQPVERRLGGPVGAAGKGLRVADLRNGGIESVGGSLEKGFQEAGFWLVVVRVFVQPRTPRESRRKRG